MMKEYQFVSGTAYDHRTPLEVIRVLEKARLNRTRLHISLGDAETGLHLKRSLRRCVTFKSSAWLQRLLRDEMRRVEPRTARILFCRQCNCTLVGVGNTSNRLTEKKRGYQQR